MGIFVRKTMNLFSFDFMFFEYLFFFKMSMMCFGLLIALCLVPKKVRN